MRARYGTIGTCLLVVMIILVGLTGCERKAPSREGEIPEGGNTSQPGTTKETPVAGETVVSAVTSAPQGTPVAGEAQPTPLTGTTTEPSSPDATAAPSGSTPAAAVTEPTAVPPAQTETGGADFVWYTVQSGDTLNSIAQRYSTTWSAIATANDLTNPSQIYVGQKLKIPTSAGSSGGTTTGCRVNHKVKSGEWVWQIARQYGVSPYDILSANNLSIATARTIYPGMVLCIP